MIIRPHGGILVNQMLSEQEGKAILQNEKEFFSLTIDDEKAVEVQNIATGLYSPLQGFMNRSDVNEILQHDRLASGFAWTIPIVLDIGDEDCKRVRRDQTILLIHRDRPIATLKVEDIFGWDRDLFARQVFGTEDPKHPGVAKLQGMGPHLVGGLVHQIIPPFSDFSDYYLTPRETRVLFGEKQWQTVVGFQTRNVPHLGHEYVQKTALSTVDGLFINPVIGKKKAGDFTDRVILDSYRALIERYYVPDHTVMSILQTEMRYAGPKEAIFHAIVRKNFGCSHFIIGRDHAGVGSYYHPFAAQAIFDRFPDLEITPIFFMSFFFCRTCNSIANDKTCPHQGDARIDFAGKIIREKLVNNEIPPENMMRREVSQEILKSPTPFVTGV